MAHQKNKSFVRRLFGRNAPAESEAIICRPFEGDDGPFFRYRKEGGMLVPVDGFPYDAWNSCMGIKPEDADRQGDAAGSGT